MLIFLFIVTTIDESTNLAKDLYTTSNSWQHNLYAFNRHPCC